MVPQYEKPVFVTFSYAQLCAVICTKLLKFNISMVVQWALLGALFVLIFCIAPFIAWLFFRLLLNY